MKNFFFNEIYWVGFGMFVGLPFAAHFLQGGGFDFGTFFLAMLVYTILFVFFMKATRY